MINGGSLRRTRQDGTRVTNMELFFDLVYVFAVTQLTQLLLQHLSWHGAGQMALMLLAVWWAWASTVWFTNWFNPDARPVRLPLIVIMLGSLIMSATLPHAFGDRGLYVAATYTVIQVGRGLWIISALGDDPPLRRNYQRIVAWVAAGAVFWVVGGFAQGTTREVLWLAALAIEYASPAFGFYTPGLGRSTTATWNISGAHMAERCSLFVIIALGESILATGRSFGEGEFTAGKIGAFVVAFAGSVALWWVYFDRTIGDATATAESTGDPGRLGRTAYTYFHLPIVAGIIVFAAGDELTIAHPTGHSGGAQVATVLGGPALFLGGHALYKRAIFQTFSANRIGAILVLAALAPVAYAVAVPPLALAGIATAVVAAVSVLDAIGLGRAARNRAP